MPAHWHLLPGLGPESQPDVWGEGGAVRELGNEEGTKMLCLTPHRNTGASSIGHFA